MALALKFSNISEHIELCVGFKKIYKLSNDLKAVFYWGEINFTVYRPCY
jgi:hypothetical protein